MYIAREDSGTGTQWARIGRVRFSKTGRTLYYAGRELAGMGQPWYRDAETGEQFHVGTASPYPRQNHDQSRRHRGRQLSELTSGAAPCEPLPTRRAPGNDPRETKPACVRTVVRRDHSWAAPALTTRRAYQLYAGLCCFARAHGAGAFDRADAERLPGTRCAPGEEQG